MVHKMQGTGWPFRAAALLVLAASGCAVSPQRPAARALPPPTPRRVEFANLTARTSSVDAGASVTADELLARIAALLPGENAAARVQRLILRFPDASLELLRNTSAAQAAQPERIAASVAYDRAFIADGSTGWTRTLADAVLRPKEYESIRGARLLTLQLIEMGRPEQVLAQVKTPAGSTFPFAQAELLRVRGIAALLCDRPADAIRDWKSAREATRADRGVYSEFLLLQAEALRSGGAAADSRTQWTMAAAAAASVSDPNLWQRIIEARDEATPWPAKVVTAFEGGVSAAVSPVAVEARIWRQIGEWRFSRSETPGALLAFKQAEALSLLPRDRDSARIDQARVLLTMNQTGPAISILASLINDPDPQVSHHALAVLGNARIGLDDLPAALRLLQQAVADDDPLPVSLRAPARADLGLVYLMSSHEQEGLDWLHRAQADFESDRDNAGLVQCLQNEAAYLEQIGRTEQAREIRKRASRISAAY
jgi:tetratricopeptide (TPR) repeat protein